MKDFKCRHFKGDKPCRFSAGKNCLVHQISNNRPDSPCVETQLIAPLHETGHLINQNLPCLEGASCKHFDGIEKSILIIKLGALGDVLRTTTLLSEIEKKYPGVAVSWLTKPGAVPLLQKAGIWKILPWCLDSVIWVENIEWDCLICLDKEDGPTALAERLKGKKKYGFGRNKYGLLRPLSESSDYLFQLGIDDEKKFFTNQKTYPRMIAEACELDWGPSNYVLNLTESEKAWAEEIARDWGTGIPIGINVGAGDLFAGKKWPVDRLVTLAEEIRAESMAPVFFGGEMEKADYQHIKNQAWECGIFPGCEFSLREFAALVSQLKVMVSGDSLAMHVAISQGVYSVAMFGATVASEIEFYGNGEALSAKVPCSPCFKRICPTKEECMSGISVKDVLAAILRGTGKG